MVMIEKAYAKVNLALNVFKKNENNYHDLESIMLPLQLHDTIEIAILPPENTDDFITCDDYSLKVVKYNLCHKAIDVCRKRWNFKEKFRVVIHKRIFIQSGLGGGSADAAATIRGIIKLLKLNPTDQELIEIGIELGSDVPFCLFSKPSVVKQIGQSLTFFEHKRDDYVLIVKYPLGLSTQEVFEESDKHELDSCNLEEVKGEFINGNPNLKNSAVNALQKVSFGMLPELEKLYNLLKEENFDFVQMTGSGSAIFCLTKNKKLANKMEEKYFKKGYQVELTQFLIN